MGVFKLISCNRNVSYTFCIWYIRHVLFWLTFSFLFSFFFFSCVLFSFFRPMYCMSIGGVMVSVFSSQVQYRGSSPQHLNVTKWSNISTRVLLFQWTSTVKIQLRVLFSLKRKSSLLYQIVTYARHDIVDKLFTWH